MFAEIDHKIVPQFELKRTIMNTYAIDFIKFHFITNYVT